MRALLWVAGLAVAATTASAQSIPPVTKVKQSATRAVASANARTEASSTVAEDTASKGAAPRGGRVATDSAAGSTAVTSPGATFERETYLYERGGRRDPFVSLMTTSDLRPLITDLRLVAVAYDASGRGSVAILHDLSAKEKAQYRIRVGQSLGRMRVSSITPKAVVFTIEEFGYSRQETLALGDSNTERKQ